METVKEDCKREDCVYRMYLNRTTRYCGYCMVTGHPRDCSIYDCDKYRTGKKRIVLDNKTMCCKWVIEDEED